MSLNRISSALLPWFLCLSFLPSRVALTTDSTPTSPSATSISTIAAPPTVSNNNSNNNNKNNKNNTTLIFEGSAPVDGLHYCSCQGPVHHCNESQANELCSCHRIPHDTRPPAGSGLVTVWLRGAGLLQDVLNGSRVHHLQLVSCGGMPWSPQYLALLGLRTLRIHSSTPGVPYPDQELAIASPDARSSSSEVEVAVGDGADRGLLSPLRLTFLDVALLNGLSALKAYSVTGRSVSTLATQFPHLPLGALLRPPAASTTTTTGPGGSPGSHDQVRDPHGECLLTFVY